MQKNRPALLGRILSGLFIGASGCFCVLFYGSYAWQKTAFTIGLVYGAAALILGVVLPQRARLFYCAFHGVGLSGALLIFLLLTLGGGRYPPIQGSYAQSLYAAPGKVMVVVAHPDDDLNLAAGVIESYRAQATPVKVVFLSNGDAEFCTPYRLLEALRCQRALGVPAQDVTFLGYGDQYNSRFGHIYNAPPSELLTSDAGFTHTYALKRHPEYRRARSGGWSDYTRASLVWDMQELISQELPDVIYCIDQDFHPDHRATSLLFEEALGLVLGSGADYHPAVYKGFGYSTAWMAEADYYALNLPSTRQPYENGRMEETETYRWADRLRLPLLPQSLAYTRRASGLYPAFTAYGSQKALSRMGRVVNSDKVFWPRRTDSLLYTARFSAASADTLWLLNNFKLADSDHIAQRQHRPFDGAWVPAPGDLLTVELKEAASVQEIVLYDNPAPDQNLLQVRITLSTGRQLLTGPLDPGGAPTPIATGEAAPITGFTLEFLQAVGEAAGLCELEAYASSAVLPGFIKLVDENDAFVYTYTPSTAGELRFGLYASTPELDTLTQDLAANFTAEANGQPLVVENGQFVLPETEKTVRLRVSVKSDPALYDEIEVRPYSAARNAWLPKLWALDEFYCAYASWTGYHLAHLENSIRSQIGLL